MSDSPIPDPRIRNLSQVYPVSSELGPCLSIVFAQIGIERAAMDAQPSRCPNDIPCFGRKCLQNKMLLNFLQCKVAEFRIRRRRPLRWPLKFQSRAMNRGCLREY
jgi:hypothetical protein